MPQFGRALVAGGRCGEIDRAADAGFRQHPKQMVRHRHRRHPRPKQEASAAFPLLSAVPSRSSVIARPKLAARPAGLRRFAVNCSAAASSRISSGPAVRMKPISALASADPLAAAWRHQCSARRKFGAQARLLEQARIAFIEHALQRECPKFGLRGSISGLGRAAQPAEGFANAGWHPQAHQVAMAQPILRLPQTRPCRVGEQRKRRRMLLLISKCFGQGKPGGGNAEQGKKRLSQRCDADMPLILHADG